MALEDKVDEMICNEFEIANESYDKKKFTSHMGIRGDVENYSKSVRENSGNIGDLKDLASILATYMPLRKSHIDEDIKANYSKLVNNPHDALVLADTALSHDAVSLAKYAERNRDKILDDTTAEQLYDLVNQVPLYKTGKKEHDEVVDLLLKARQIQETARDRGDLAKIVSKEVAATFKKLPKSIQEYIGLHQEDYKKSFTNFHISRIMTAAGSLFRDEDGKPDKKALRGFIEDNYQAVNNYIEDQVNELEPDKEKRKKARNKLWDKNLKHQYVALAKALNATASKEQKMGDNPEWETIKANAKKMGMAA